MVLLEPAPYRPTGSDDFKTAVRYQYQPSPGCTPQDLMQLPLAIDRENKNRECANQAIDHRREIDDLIQQTRAAEAAEEANWYAQANFNLGKLHFFLALFGAVALAVSLLLTWRALAATREIGEAQVRAYLTIDASDGTIILLNFAPGRIPAVKFRVKNTGASPAFNHQFAAGVLYMASDYARGGDRIIDPMSGPTSSMNVLAPSEIQAATTNTDVVWTDDMFQTVVGPRRTHKMILVGVLVYKDVFKKPRSTQFCFEAGFKRVEGGLGPTQYSVSWYRTGHHNDAD